MKKIIIAVLLLIPLIVILTISASGMIISAEVAIEIESVELWHKGEQTNEATINLGEYRKKNLRYQLIPRYYPGVASVTGFTWKSDNPSVATVDEDGIVSFHDCGFAKVTVVSKDRISVRASCSFFVEDDEIHSLTCYSGGDTAVSSLSMPVYDAKQLRVDVMPYSAFVDDLEWTTSDPSVLTCSANGVVKAKKEGNATVSVRARSKTGKVSELTIPVTVSGTAVVKQKAVYLYGDGEVNLDNYLTSGSKTVDLSEIAVGGSQTYTVEGAQITVHRLAHQNTLGIADLDLILANEWKDGVYVAAGRSVALSPIDLATSAAVEGASLSVSDSSVLSVEQGKIRALSAGRATVTFSKPGYENCTLEVNVAIPISYFALNVDEENDLIGVGSIRAYGTKSVYDGVIANGIRIQAQNVYPTTGSRSLFSYKVTDGDATVDETGLLTFGDQAVGNTVTVEVKSLLSTSNISRSYTFRNIVKGINVGFGFGDNTFNAEKNERPSYVPYNDALLMMYEDRSYALVFQTNIYMPTREEIAQMPGEHNKLRLIRDYYGNGYKIDGQFYQYDYESHIFEDADDKIVEPGQTGVTITELLINSYAPVGDDSKKTFEALMTTGGEPIRSFFKEKTDFCITFRYCIFQYSYSHACLIGGTFVFDGCVFRNSAGVSLMIQSLHGQENYVTVNNCIFSNSISMAGLVSNGTFPADRKEAVRYNSITWTGDNYIYNWKKTDEVKLDIIPKGLMKNAALDSLLEGVNDKLTDCARNSFQRGANKDLLVTHEKDEYVNMGFVFINFWCPDNLILNGTRENVTDGLLVNHDVDRSSFVQLKLNTDALGYAKNALKSYLDLERPTYIMTNKTADGTYTTAPGETYKLDEKTFARLRGEGNK